MAEKNNAYCSICGSGYYVCISCKDKMRLHPYKISCCSPSHFQVSQVVRGFSTGVYNKEEFKSKLQNIDLSDLDSYKEHIKVLIKDALKKDEIVEAEAPVTKEVETGKAEEMVIEKSVYPRKRKYKVNNEVEEA